jgi:hypothetical protein
VDDASAPALHQVLTDVADAREWVGSQRGLGGLVRTTSHRGRARTSRGPAPMLSRRKAEPCSGSVTGVVQRGLQVPGGT